MSSSAEPLGRVAATGRRPVPDAAAPAMAGAAPARAAGVVLLGELEGSGYRNAPWLVRRADGQTVQLTPLLYHLLAAVDGRRDHAELAAAVGERIGKLPTPEQAQLLLETKLHPLGLLRLPDGSEPVVAKPNPLLALRLKYVVSNPAVTSRLAAPFALLFQPAVVLAFVLAFGLTVGWLLFQQGLASAARQALYQPGFLLVVFGLTVLSALFHELGHAAACRYSGARPGAMGVGLYLVWPAFYTDVSDSYRLRRADRLRVDLGGLYFNAIFAVGILGLWALLDKDALLLVIAAQLLQMVRQLIPIVRFDGYHALADLTGVPDLFAHIKPTLVGVFRRGGPASPLKPWARAVVTAWVAITVPLLLAILVLLVIVLPRILATAWDSLGLHAAALAASAGGGDVTGASASLLSVVLVSLPVLGIAYLLVRLSRRLGGFAWRRTAGRPVWRAGAVGAGIVLVGLLAWAWWPDDRYRPIEADDRWVVLDLPLLTAEKLQPDPARVLIPRPAAALAAAPAPAPRPAGRPLLVLLPQPAPARGTVVVRPVVLPQAPAAAVATPAPVPAPRTASPPAPRVRPVPALPPAAPAPAEPAPAVPAEVAVTPVPPADPPANPWPFPFRQPREPGEGDNQVVAVGQRDGETTYRTAVALVWVTDGSDVKHRNEAWALSTCTGCTTVAVAFQVVLVVGYAEIVQPINAAVAVNWECEGCNTNALALQLVATLTRAPSEQTVADVNRIWSAVERAAGNFEQLPFEQVYAQLSTARALILGILAREGATTTLSRGEEAAAAAEAPESPPPAPTTTAATTTTEAPPPAPVSTATTTAATTETMTTSTTNTETTTTGGTTETSTTETSTTETSPTATTTETTTTAETTTTGASTTAAGTTTSSTTTTSEDPVGVPPPERPPDDEEPAPAPPAEPEPPAETTP